MCVYINILLLFGRWEIRIFILPNFEILHVHCSFLSLIIFGALFFFNLSSKTEQELFFVVSVNAPVVPGIKQVLWETTLCILSQCTHSSYILLYRTEEFSRQDPILNSHFLILIFFVCVLFEFVFLTTRICCFYLDSKLLLVDRFKDKWSLERLFDI